jgi:hypothetical protein
MTQAQTITQFQILPPPAVGAEIFVTIKNVYGTEQIYPVCANAEIFAQIAGTKTLTKQTINLIKDLGFQIQVVVEKTTL